MSKFFLGHPFYVQLLREAVNTIRFYIKRISIEFFKWDIFFIYMLQESLITQDGISRRTIYANLVLLTESLIITIHHPSA